MTASLPIEFTRDVVDRRGTQLCGNRVQLEDASGDPYTGANPLPIAVGSGAAPTWAALQTAAMGNLAAVIVVPANANRRGLFLRNCSDTTGYFAIGSAAGLVVGTCIFHLAAGQTMPWNDGAPTQAIYAICGAAAKNVAYQEGV